MKTNILKIPTQKGDKKDEKTKKLQKGGCCRQIFCDGFCGGAFMYDIAEQMTKADRIIKP